MRTDAGNFWQAVIARALKGERAAVTELISAAQNPLFVFCFHLSKNKQLAEDLTHDALLKSLSALATLQRHESYLPWLKKIARGLFLDYLKSAENAKSHLQLDELGEEESLHADPSISEHQIHALRTLQKLDEEDRTILILIDIQGMSYDETAEVLDHPIGTIKSKLSRAREKYIKLFNGTTGTERSSVLKIR